jgi:phosphoglycolate phosphatase-like HAD superfamily hydrolase
MTGDTPYDAKAAQDSGVSALGVLTGGFSLAALKNAGCYAAIKEVGEMKQFLKTSERTPAVEKTPLAPLS